MNDYIPDSHPNRLAWLKNLKSEIAIKAAVLQWNAAKLVLVNALLDPLIAKYQILVDAEQAAIEASGAAAQIFNSSGEDLRGLVNEIKNNTGYDPGMGAVMQILLAGSKKDPATIKPSIEAEAHHGFVRITGSKDYAELYNLYMRIVGTAAWTLIGARRKKFPFDDQTPLKTPGAYEEREYYAQGVIDDQEIGLPSDIVSVTFPG